MTLPKIHPYRNMLNDEVHARPSEAIHNPVRITYLALLTPWQIRDEDSEPIRMLAGHYGKPGPVPGANHFTGDMGPFRLKWERHTEFSRFRITVDHTDGDPFLSPPLDLLPEDWVSQLPGELIFATHAALLNADKAVPDPDELSQRYFNGNMVVGSEVTGKAARAFTDFRIHADGFNRILVQNVNMTPWQAGRAMQRVLEMETYRILALLALPVAQGEKPLLTEHEEEFSKITSLMSTPGSIDEPDLLDRLTKLQSAVESRHSNTHYRFSAAAAYYDLVQRRVMDLREERIVGLQTFSEFTARRLAPAMATCETVADRKQSLSERVARATQLLSTRVDLILERQNQDLLETMNRRAALQLRQQRTIEGLSVVAGTYYLVGLVDYAATGLKSAGLDFNTDLLVALSVPLVVVLVVASVGQIRALISPDTKRKKSKKS